MSSSQKRLPVEDGIKLGQEMMKSLKETFDEKGREVSAWKFKKVHNVKHVLLCIIILGWIEIFTGQSGDRGHRELLKALANCVNNRSFHSVSELLAVFRATTCSARACRGG